jgi:hypothetical protein
MSSALDLREDCSLEALFPRIANPSAGNKITVMGHRGGFKPDNSMASFQRALDSSCVQIVELDVSDIFLLNSVFRFGLQKTVNFLLFMAETRVKLTSVIQTQILPKKATSLI